MTKIFAINNPDQLKAIGDLAKEGDATIVARVWNATRRKNGGACSLDGRVMVSFYTEGRKRHAVVFRITSIAYMEEIAVLKYQAALAWCRKHLQEVKTISWEGAWKKVPLQSEHVNAI